MPGVRGTVLQEDWHARLKSAGDIHRWDAPDRLVIGSSRNRPVCSPDGAAFALVSRLAPRIARAIPDNFLAGFGARKLARDYEQQV